MLLIPIGFLIGTVGTLIGVGGGFILIPILIFMFPQVPSQWISSVSMFVVAMNASSGSFTYFLRGRVHLRSALYFILASLPGSLLGVWIERFVSRALFELIFGCTVILYALVLLLRRTREDDHGSMNAHSQLPTKIYSQGCAISFFVGFIASFFGIGGGVVHVPLLAHVLGFPVHMATGTSHMILAITAWFTTAVHLYNGDVKITDPVLWQLGVPALIGAQLGAHLSSRVSGNLILKILAIALMMVGIRLVLHHIPH